MDDIKNLCAQWIAIKEQEKEAANYRRELEDKIIQRLQIQGSTKKEVDGFSITATTRINRKVDANRAREIADENHFARMLPKLFRWKAEIALREWDKADPVITQALSEAITETESRPSFKIEEM